MDTNVLVSTGSLLWNYPSVLWGVLVSNFGTIPALLISALIILGVYFVIRGVSRWLFTKIKELFSKQKTVMV